MVTPYEPATRNAPKDGKPSQNKDRYTNRPQHGQPRPSSSVRTNACHHCGSLEHFIRECPSYKSLKTPVFLALAKTYTGKQIPCLDTLIASINQRVCRWCLKPECREECGGETADMAEAKDKFFHDGSYELVMQNKMSQPTADSGHSRFTKASYLSTFKPAESEGADTTEDANEAQDSFSIGSAIMNEEEATTLQEELTGNDDPDSEDDVEEDVDENHN